VCQELFIAYIAPSALACWTAVSGPPEYGSIVSFIRRFGAVTLRMKQMKTRKKKEEQA